MKHISRFTLGGLLLVLAGCSTVPVTEPELETPESEKPAKAPKGPPYAQASKLKSTVNFTKLNEQWPSEPAVTQIDDAFRVTLDLGEKQVAADTHLFGKVNVIPYSSEDSALDARERPVGRGDAVLSTYFPPGEVGISVEHHRPENRLLSFDGTDSETMKEHFKFQDSHAGMLVGVEREGAPGVITLNNPQAFENGSLGEAYNPRLYFRPAYPWYLPKERQDQFRDNIRTMAVGFNAVSNFPDDYNGGDPLAARNPAEVREHVRQMVRAIGGDAAAREWFQKPEHQLYCAEFVFLSYSAGLIVPLNEATLSELAGPEWAAKFKTQVENHNAGTPSAFTELNENTNVKYVTLALADPALRPAAEYAPLGGAREQKELAFRPMTAADIFEHFIAIHLPRSLAGEGLAPVQAAVFQKLQPGLLELMGMHEYPPSHPERKAVQGLFDRLTAVVSKEYDSYASFRAAVEPLMEEARMLSGPRDGSGTGLFVPPHLMHLVALGRQKGGLIGLDYVGHALHWSLLDRENASGLGALFQPR